MMTARITELSSHSRSHQSGSEAQNPLWRSRLGVSTLAEAEAIAAEGFADILYAVGLAPHKLPRVLNLHRSAATAPS